MKPAIRRSIISITAIALLLGAVLGAMFYRFHRELQTLRPLPSRQILNGLWSIQDRNANLFIIRTGDAAIAIDAGNSVETVRVEMKRLGLNPESVRAVFLTHSDADHTGALKLFNKATVYLSKAEEPMITGKIKRFLFVGNKLDVPWKTLEDNEVLRVGGATVRAILTPGHTPGSTCYVVNDRFLFTGDTLSLRSGTVDTFNELFNMDTATEKKSMPRLAGLAGVTHLFTAHYGFSDNYPAATAPLRR